VHTVCRVSRVALLPPALVGWAEGGPDSYGRGQCGGIVVKRGS